MEGVSYMFDALDYAIFSIVGQSLVRNIWTVYFKLLKPTFIEEFESYRKIIDDAIAQ